jgi:regulator of sigma E protease
MTSLLVVIGVAGMFLLLIAPHEAGHFALAKLFKVRVLEFSIGAGTRLWSTTRGGTLYAIRALPILGYVRMGGMEAGDFEDPQGFHRKPAWQRILILAAGPAANFVVAMICITGLNLANLNDDPGKVTSVQPNYPAGRTGFVAGDRIETVNGQPMSEGYIRKVEDAAPGVPFVLTGVHPNGRGFSYVVAPFCAKGQSCVIGLGTARIITPVSAIVDGVKWPFNTAHDIVLGLGQLVTGQVPGGLLGPNGVTGPIGITDVTIQAVTLGLDKYILFVALLSVALGFTNVLPFLALDGGRIVVVLIEVVRRRPFDRTAELNFQRAGLAALLGLAVVISVLDIQRIATGQFPGVR